MGFFSGQVIQESFDNVMVPDIKGYNDGYYSAKQAMVDNIMNEQAMFEGMIMTDIQESVMRHSGASDGELIAFAENVITDVLEKIKEFLMKVWEKIKAIFRGWMAKIESVMGKNNKEFVNKYRKVVLGKDLTDMKVTWRKPKAELKSGIVEFKIADIQTNLSISTWASNASDDNDKKDPQKKLDSWDQDDELCKILQNVTDNKIKSLTDSKDFEKEFIDYYLEDEEEDDTVGNDINGIMAELLAHKDLKKSWNRANNSLNKAMTAMTKEIDKDVTSLSKAMPITGDKSGNNASISGAFALKKYKITGTHAGGYAAGSDADTYKDDDQNVQSWTAGGRVSSKSTTVEANKKNVEYIRKGLLIVQKFANLYATAANKYTAAVMKVLKMWNDGNRKVWAAAVAYSRKEEAVMTEALIELAEYESM